jgi:hypothetical protein
LQSRLHVAPVGLAKTWKYLGSGLRMAGKIKLFHVRTCSPLNSFGKKVFYRLPKTGGGGAGTETYG